VPPKSPRLAATLARLIALLATASGCCGLGLGRTEPRADAEYTAHIEELREDTPRGFTVVAVPPFIVIGDGPPEAVRADADSVVRWAAQRLKADYFPRDPSEILNVWMFDGEESYLRNTSALFGRTPPSPYGYYSPCDKALIINIALGAGTLVHEMVHAFIEANFPDCPPWFNEGLASLYEQTDEEDGHIHGRVNWRLPGLQRAIQKIQKTQKGRGPRLADVLSASRGEFYGDERGAMYAAARYLCYYLQEKGLLRRFYKEFHARHDDDPTGEETLADVLGAPTVDAIQPDWEAFVLGLSNP
jgi:hypothetical protein